jgi:phospholipid/cholesterol/gamma-HCH transport system substrate-binding protein
MERGPLLRGGVLALGIVLFVVVVLKVVGGSGGYTLHAQFNDASQLVKGDLVEVGGQQIGTVSDIRLTDDNLADVVLKITDDEFKNLRRGTRAQVRTVGLSGVANRFVEITPGPQSQPKIPDGGVLSPESTQPVVDLDELLTSLDKPTRDKLRSIILDGAKIYAGDASANANLAAAYANPAFTQLAGLTNQLAHDAAAFEQLITASGTVSKALASRSPDIEQGVSNTATALRAIATEANTFEDSLGRTPAVLHQSDRTLSNLRSTLVAVRPALREAEPLAPLVKTLVPRLLQSSRQSAPTFATLRTLLEPARQAFLRMVPLANVQVPAMAAAARAVSAVEPIVRGLEPYAPDLVGGFVNAFGGTDAGTYDANGHWSRVSPMFGQGNNGAIGALFGTTTIPGITELRTHITARCPGAAARPAPDGSNPFIPFDGLCNKDHGQR